MQDLSDGFGRSKAKGTKRLTDFTLPGNTVRFVFNSIHFTQTDSLLLKCSPKLQENGLIIYRYIYITINYCIRIRYNGPLYS